MIKFKIIRYLKMDLIKQKALELYNKFPLGNRKESAIVCVNEILNVIEETEQIIYWLKVKKYLILEL